MVAEVAVLLGSVISFFLSAPNFTGRELQTLGEQNLAGNCGLWITAPARSMCLHVHLYVCVPLSICVSAVEAVCAYIDVGVCTCMCTGMSSCT